MKLTEEIPKKIIKKYLKNPDDCPFCENKDGKGLNADNNDISPETNLLWRNIKCNDCGRRWVEQFRLELISDLEEND